MIMFLIIAGSFGPFVAAGLCITLRDGPAAALRFYMRVFEVRMGWVVFLLSFLLLPVLAIVSAWLYEKTGHEPLSVQTSLATLPATYFWLLLLGGPVGEEFGWTYLADALDEHCSLLVSSVLISLVWALWHLPLFFLTVPGLAQRFVPFSLFVAMSFSTRFFFNWAYHRSGRNLLANLVGHNALNLSLSIVTIVTPAVGGDQTRLIYMMVGLALVTALLWRLLPVGASRSPRQPVASAS